MLKLLVLSLGFSAASYASTVAVIDSGLDVDHPDLQGHIWRNPVDSTFDRADQDGNGKVDDVFGWNFIKDDNFLIDITQAGLLNDEVKKFFSLQTKVLLGKDEVGDKDWLKEKAGDQEFRSRLMQFAAFAHGTHVSGIVAAQSADNKVLTVRLIPTSSPFQDLERQVRKAQLEGKEPHWIVKYLIKGGLIAFAKVQASVFTPISGYLAFHKVDVVNGSFGFGVPQARGLVTPLLRLALNKEEPSDALVDEYALFLTRQVVDAQNSLVTSAQDTLFVFAAGNDGTSNDVYPVAPASLRHPNTISVAAVTPSGEVATFSNFGETVDIAAPGVGIESLSPRGPRITMSGTSQAAPVVAGVAGAVKTINPSLTPSEVKQIILGTADLHTFYKTKVASGLLNAQRAATAAQLSVDHPVLVAITQAKELVKDVSLPASVASFTTEAWINFLPTLVF